MSIARGRVHKASPATAAALPIERQTTLPVPAAQRIPRDAVEAYTTARARLEQAEQEAARLVRDAENAALEIRNRAEIEGRKAGAAALATEQIRFAELEARADERSLGRTIELATVLAERLLGEALALDPTRVIAIATTVLAEARGAKQIQIHAHPEDRVILAAEAERLSLTATAFHDAHDLKRGELRVETELGSLEAQLTPELQRFAATLRQALASPR